MDIKLTDKALRKFLDTSISAEKLASAISLCGPTFDRISKHGDDYLYEIEIITNRIDSASAQGVARDSNAILNQLGIKSVFKNDPYQEIINLYPNLPKSIRIEIENKDLVPRFTAVSLENITIKESPEETKTLLTLCDERPINNAVDITNELTLLYGMPSHVFDQDKLATQKLLIRESKKGEEVTTLDNQKNKLQGGEIVIEDGSGKLVDLCGIMGGQVAEVDQYTKNILLIVPVYHPNKIRRASLNLQKRTLAAQIYEKQPDTELCLPVMMNAIKLFKERTGAQVNSAVYDSAPTSPGFKEIALDVKWANNLIGLDIPERNIVSILESLGFSVKASKPSVLMCTVPSWRKFDINIKEDLVEEIARVYGYSKLPAIIPCVNLSPEPKDPVLTTESKIKNYLSCQGFNEIYNNSLISINQIKSSLLEESEHLKLQNSLSQDFEYLRTSLVPSILQNIKNNQGKSDEPFLLYETSNIYLPTKQKLPHEISKVAISSAQDFRHTKGLLNSLFSHLNLKTAKYKTSVITPSYFAIDNTATIFSGNKVLGFIGSIKPSILHQIGITSNPTIIELDTDSIAKSIASNYVYKPIPEFPGVVESVTIKSSDKIGEIMDKIKNSSNLISNIVYTDSFQSNHSFKITFSSPEKNLTQPEVNEVKKSIQSLFK